jgi:uncharacterized membrane protein
MALLVLGLALFLGSHSVRVLAEPWRLRVRERVGANAWRGGLLVVALVGFVLLVVGYGQTRLSPVDLWWPPVWTRHVAALLTLPVFVLLATSHGPVTRIKAAVKHPMVVSVKLWATAHLLANGRLGDVVLFGAMLAWAVLDFRAARKRDRADGIVYEPGPVARDARAVVIGLVLWVAFTFSLHARLIGVAPLSLSF